MQVYPALGLCTLPVSWSESGNLIWREFMSIHRVNEDDVLAFALALNNSAANQDAVIQSFSWQTGCMKRSQYSVKVTDNLVCETCCVFQGLVVTVDMLFTSCWVLARTLSRGVQESRGSTASSHPTTSGKPWRINRRSHSQWGGHWY